ncbi:uncharacterized protein BDZ99DRAFT_468678 [Mytilinidion resinicola]|uniref:Uncharacterized protein n=1 Tax=Mytilinidion resinicola TaxID=574789 RepID=A0A6A6Y3U3_9PEZI|nr:uncharacterized protein BDZ99DRAFT_468678 [Mytilinidion resinicola]KAF2802694.1 hypothetical protein BDZ99DRAFT_468678 [Mytilinidion resinicola]
MNSMIRGAVTSRRFVFAAVTVILIVLFFNAIPSGYGYLDSKPEVPKQGTAPPKPPPENAASSSLASSASSPLAQPSTLAESPQPSKQAPASPSTAPSSSSSSSPASPSSTPSAKKPDNELSKTAILASLQKEDTTWLSAFHPEVAAAIYVVDNTTAPYTVPKNKGHEGMVYLTYIIDHYTALPDVMVFLHAHRYAWHNPDLLGSDAAEIIDKISAPYVQRMGYVNVRCHWDPGCPTWMHPLAPETERTDVFKPEEVELAKAFREIFPGEEVPEILAQPCCAQFALSGDQARKISLERYTAVRQWLLDTELDDAISGRIWEYLWQYLFTGKPISCPRMDLCYCDGFGVCFGGDKGKSGEQGMNEFWHLRNEKNKLQAALGQIVDEKEDEDGKKITPVLTDAEKHIVKDLEAQIKDFEDQLNERLKKAKKRGTDPKLRAEDCGRDWKKGDGF